MWFCCLRLIRLVWFGRLGLVDLVALVVCCSPYAFQDYPLKRHLSRFSEGEYCLAQCLGVLQLFLFEPTAAFGLLALCGSVTLLCLV